MLNLFEEQDKLTIKEIMSEMYENGINDGYIIAIKECVSDLDKIITDISNERIKDILILLLEAFEKKI